MLLKKLTESIGVSGNEGEIRKIVIEEIKDYADEVKVDKIGNVIAYKKGKKENSTIMVSTNMDEFGLIVSEIGSTGLIKFMPVGSIDTKFLPSKRVVIGEKKVPGVIGAKPIHLQERSERKKPIDRKSLYIDIGAKSKDDAEKYVKIGDYIGIDSDYIEFGNDLIKSKFIESRVGVNILIDLLKKDLENSIYVVFSVMKNIGLVGVGPAAFGIEPDINISVEGIATTEYPDSNGQNSKIKLNDGPGISLYDKRNIYNKKLNIDISKIIENEDIKVQYTIQSNHDSSSSKVYVTNSGIPSTSISVPIRYMCSPVSTISKNDYINTEKLLLQIINNL